MMQLWIIQIENLNSSSIYRIIMDMCCVSSAKSTNNRTVLLELTMRLMYIRNKSGPKIDPRTIPVEGRR